MGDRANVVVRYGNDDQVILYTHWGGEDLPKKVASALERGRDRWNDFPYLARIIFSEMVKGKEDQTTGFGISGTRFCDGSDRVIKIDCKTGTVNFNGIDWVFEKYIEEAELSW